MPHPHVRTLLRHLHRTPSTLRAIREATHLDAYDTLLAIYRARAGGLTIVARHRPGEGTVFFFQPPEQQ
jgi:hypothetical protein